MGRGHAAVAGRWAEQRTLRLLAGRGWRILDRNWHCRWGELDLVVVKPGRLLVVEVKGRSAPGPDGSGLAPLWRGQATRLRRASLCWLAAHPSYQQHRLELVVALVGLPPRAAAVRWLSLSDWSQEPQLEPRQGHRWRRRRAGR